jgi:hypothetical protein
MTVRAIAPMRDASLLGRRHKAIDPKPCGNLRRGGSPTVIELLYASLLLVLRFSLFVASECGNRYSGLTHRSDTS